ncbi:hypothetical protein ACH4TU_04795 [Streptomyces physcomitrii]|uniref:hypothetical protein n=1 Tax=Streptomyces physcomitrii TaxID=2724184 RepID=UPI001640057B
MPFGVRDEVRETFLRSAGPTSFIFATGSNINAGTVHGGQQAHNETGASGIGGGRVEAQEGPISQAEITAARFGFAEPAWFPEAMRRLDTGLLFLAGPSRHGRRTAALNLLYRHSGGALLSALDGDTNLATWQPGEDGSRGYLVDGLLATADLKPGMIGNLRNLMEKARARMVIIVSDEPGILRSLERDLHLSPIRCTPPPAQAVFDARFEATVPDPAERARMLAALEPGLLRQLLVTELVPAEVAELVTAVAESGEDGETASPPHDLRDRLSFLAEGEVPDLLRSLYDEPDALAFLISACVFEGLDHRIVREQADQLLKTAEGRLHSVLPPGSTLRSGEKEEPAQGDRGGKDEEEPRLNEEFVFRRPLHQLLHRVGAYRGPRQVLRGSSFTYSVEPVRFTRHRQGESVLRHVWREYGQMSEVLAAWIGKIENNLELTEPAGRTMGLAATWGGGRRALSHIRSLAEVDRRTNQHIAAHAFGVAARDPVLVTEIKHMLENWTYVRSEALRSTVAYACGAEFGLSRPDIAMRLLRSLARRTSGTEHQVVLALGYSLMQLFAQNQEIVFRELLVWAADDGAHTELAIDVLPRLLLDADWFQEQLLTGSEFAQPVLALVRRALAEERTSASTRRALLAWCRDAAWSERETAAVDLLLTALAREMSPGELGLFVAIDQHKEPRLAGRDIARQVLAAWREGRPLDDFGADGQPRHPGGSGSFTSRRAM